MFWVVDEDYPRTLLELEKRFSSEEACAGYLAALRWPAGWSCPRCAASEGWTVRRDRWLCGHCRYEMSVTAGTIFSGQPSSPDDLVSRYLAGNQPEERHQRPWSPARVGPGELQNSLGDVA